MKDELPEYQTTEGIILLENVKAFLKRLMEYILIKITIKN